LVTDLQPSLVLPFLSAFWKTLAREWSGIDVLRLDKFMYLVRLYIRAGWTFFARRGWEDSVLLAEYLGILEDGPLSTGDRQVPDGLRYHVLDLWIEELERVDEGREGKVPLETVIGSVRRLEREGLNKKVRERAGEVLGDERLVDWERKGGAGKETVEREESKDADDGGDDWEGLRD
jgi:ribosomal RNA-processing protein 1